MAVVKPFRGTVFNPAHNRIENLVTPPYDQIKPEGRARFAARDPFNIAHIILPDPAQGENRYRAAAEQFRRALASNVMVRDAQQGFYFYEQDFTDLSGLRHRRSGLVGLGRIEEFSSKIILPHEQTFPKHKEDRLNLVRHCRAYFGSIFMLYEDERFELQGWLEAWKNAHSPMVSFTDDDGNGHKLWRVCGDAELLGRVERFFAPRTLFIADGHHRYETSLNFRNEMRAKGQSHPAFDYRLMTFVNLFDPGLVILPTHRLLRGLGAFDTTRLKSAFEVGFSVEEISPKGSAAERAREILARLSGAAQGGNRIAACLPGGRVLLLDFKRDFYADLDGFERQVGLDVQVLHRIVFREILKLDESNRRDEGNIEYLRSGAQVLEGLDTGGASIGFLLNPTRLEQVRKVILNGRLMPHKSTDFYPKLYTGLVVQDLEE